jgi:hypothetical protein
LFAVAGNILYTATTEFRMLIITADIIPVVPATNAFRRLRCRRFYLDRLAALYRRFDTAVIRLIEALNACFRSDQYES